MLTQGPLAPHSKSSRNQLHIKRKLSPSSELCSDQTNTWSCVREQSKGLILTCKMNWLPLLEDAETSEMLWIEVSLYEATPRLELPLPRFCSL